MSQSNHVEPGMVFGKLTVLRLNRYERWHHYWLCRCECGKEPVIRQDDLLARNTVSCGCHRSEKNRLRKTRQIETLQRIYIKRAEARYANEQSNRDPAAYHCRIIAKDGKYV